MIMEIDMNTYAPVLITTLNRVEHLSKTIESLKACIDADKTDIYIGFDYPPSEEYFNGYDEVADYLENGDFSQFKSFNVFKREENFGIAKNWKELRSIVLKTHETFITMQDDIVVSKNFLVYINSALDYYKNDKDVIAVSGYSYPLEWKKSEGTNALKTNYVAAEWGMGHWKGKYLETYSILQNDYSYNCFIEAYKAGKLNLMTDACIKDYSITVLNKYSRYSLLRDISDVSLRIYLPLVEKYVIMPTLSHSRNLGFDGSGVYCGKVNVTESEKPYADNYDYDSQPIDNTDNYSFVPSENDYIEENRNMLNAFDRRNQKEMHSIRRKLKIYASVGPQIYGVYLNWRSFYRGVKFKLKQIKK